MLGERGSRKYLHSHSGDFCMLAAYSWSPLNETLLLSCLGQREIAVNKSGQGRKGPHAFPPTSVLSNP